MPYPKMKQERYAEIGGINQRASRYITGANEVLDLQNFDFQVPGAWQQRPGCTNALVGNTFMPTGSSGTITAIWQVIKQGPPISGMPVQGDATFKTLIGHSDGVVFYDGMAVTGSTISPARYRYAVGGGAMVDCNWNYVNYKEQSYFTPGVYTPTGSATAIPNAFKYVPDYPLDGISFLDLPTYFGQVQPQTGLSVVQNGAGTTFSGTYTYAYALRDITGFIGPIGGSVTISTSPADGLNIYGFTSALGFGGLNGTSFGFVSYALYRDHVTGFPSDQLVHIANVPRTTSGYLDNGSYNVELEIPNNPVLQNFLGNVVYTKQFSLLEVYGNRLFINNRNEANLIEFSEVDDLQNFQPESNFFVTNESYPVTGFKKFNQSMIFCLQKGVQRLTGDNGDNFNLQNISTEYGCVSVKTMVEFQEKLWFLDEKGIVEFNGASIDIISDRVQPIFARMNLKAAYQRACAVHLPERNELWFSIPVDGATINNIMVVYDYQIKAFTTFTGDKIRPTALNYTYLELVSSAQTTLANRKMFMGSIGASLFYFDTTLVNDDGVGITTSFTTLYHNELGKSRTAQFRRFYLDAGDYRGSTLTFGLEFYPNYSAASPGLTMPLYLSNFQERVDYGIPAASLSVKVTHGSTLGTPTIGGYTVEYRYQRNVST